MLPWGFCGKRRKGSAGKVEQTVSTSGLFFTGDRGFESVVEFASPEVYEFADQIYRLITAGYIKAGSVGFVPLEFKFSDRRQGGIDFKRQELLEFSICPVPANANALIEARSYRGRQARHCANSARNWAV